MKMNIVQYWEFKLICLREHSTKTPFTVGNFTVHVSLPRKWIQEIKRMTMVYFMHGLFLTCTQKSHIYSQVTELDIYKYTTILKERRTFALIK